MTMCLDADKLAICLARACMSVPELSEKSGVPINTILNVRRNHSTRPKTVGMIAQALGVDVTELLKD